MVSSPLNTLYKPFFKEDQEKEREKKKTKNNIPQPLNDSPSRHTKVTTHLFWRLFAIKSTYFNHWPYGLVVSLHPHRGRSRLQTWGVMKPSLWARLGFHCSRKKIYVFFAFNNDWGSVREVRCSIDISTEKSVCLEHGTLHKLRI